MAESENETIQSYLDQGIQNTTISVIGSQDLGITVKRGKQAKYRPDNVTNLYRLIVFPFGNKPPRRFGSKPVSG